MSDRQGKSMLVADETIPFVIASLAFVVIGLLSLGIMIHFREVRQRRRVLEKLRTADEGWTVIEPDRGGVSSDRAGGLMVRLLSAIGMKTSAGKKVDDADIKLKFLRAGLREKNAVTVFWGMKFLLAVALPMAFVAVVAVFFQGVLRVNQMLLAAVFLALIGLILPDLWLRSKTAKRKEKLARALPDALDLLVVCVEAGMGLDAAISRVGAELVLGHRELSQELKQLNLELRAGKARQTALRNLADRTDIDDVKSLVTLLIQTDRFGTSVAQALKVFSDSFRTARYQRAEEAAAKIATKLIFPLALFIFPSFFIVAIGPAAIQVYRIFSKG
jgi:tight adherence protein C